MESLPADPESLMITEAAVEGSSTSILHLNIGLQNGCLIRITLDQITGDLSDNRTRYLGTRPVRVFRVQIQGKEAVSRLDHQLINQGCWCLCDFLFSCLLAPVVLGFSTTIKAVFI